MSIFMKLNLRNIFYLIVGLEDGLPVEVYKYIKYSFFMIVLIDDIWENFKL